MLERDVVVPVVVESYLEVHPDGAVALLLRRQHAGPEHDTVGTGVSGGDALGEAPGVEAGVRERLPRLGCVHAGRDLRTGPRHHTARQRIPYEISPAQVTPFPPAVLAQGGLLYP